MKLELKEYARSLGIEYLGITSADEMCELKEILLKQREKYGINCFEEKDINKRTKPCLTLENAKSIIVCLFPYHNGDKAEGNISVYARIPDYHTVVLKYLDKICKFIKNKKESANFAPFSDSGPLVDRYLAYRAGLGFYGKNSLLINEKYGSYFFIGYIITDVLMEADTPVLESCARCNMCISLCPGKAIKDDFGFVFENCVSYITQLKQITEEQRRILSNQKSVYGCDICQKVCPHNKEIPITPIKEFKNTKILNLDKEELMLLSNRKFKQTYGDFPFVWRGKEAILKNFNK